MAGYDRPSWREIDRKRDGSSGRRKGGRNKNEVRGHSTRYDKYKADLNRLFDQGLAGELLKKSSREAPAEQERPADKPAAERAEAKSTQRRKGNGRIPKNANRSASRLKLIRAVVDAGDPRSLQAAIDDMVGQFGLPDDWEVLVRVLEHPDEELILKAVGRMNQLLPTAAKVPRRASLKERLRTIGQTAADADLRQQAGELETAL
jgi:hypothetical protein